jgi:hypothetical protein
LQIHMSVPERQLLWAFLQRSDRYLEYGSGGSTCLAASAVGGSVVAVDSDPEWLAKVAIDCAAAGSKVRPSLVRVDIGPIGEWGWPTDPGTRDRWPSYYSQVWSQRGSAEADLFLIDGRFRVACFLSVLLHGQPGAILLMHDFASREHYHVVRSVAREIAVAEDLSAFQVPANADKRRISTLLQEHGYDMR